VDANIIFGINHFTISPQEKAASTFLELIRIMLFFIFELPYYLGPKKAEKKRVEETCSKVGNGTLGPSQ
jgi:hypothetical protein